MNNEPVAWMNPSQVVHGFIDARTYWLEGFIPLYTHPHSDKSGKAKTLEPDLYSEDGFPLWTSPQFKDLTDEEIWAIASEIEPVEIQWGVRLSNELNVLDFARAILRKAQEK